MAEESAKVKFEFIVPDGYNPVFVNGAYGGPTPRGEIVVHFFVERPHVPCSLTYRLDDHRLVSEQIAREPSEEENVAGRFINTGIVMTVEGAEAIHSWLGDQIASTKELLRQRAEAIRKRKEEKA